MKRFLCAAFALATAVLSSSPAMAAPADAVRAFDRANESYQQALAREGVVGGSVMLLGPRDLSELRHYGVADRETGARVDAQSLFHWASVTKVFTGIAIMQLVERGLLSLDDPAVRFLPQLRRVHNPYGPIEAITIRHLLSHSAGFRSPTWPWNMDGAAERSDAQPHEPADWQQVEAMLPYTAVAFPPGSRASYSNLGASLLGRIVELISGDPIQVYIDKNILKPLGMTRTYFDATPWMMRANRVRGYSLRDGALRAGPPEVMTGATVGNGGLNGPIEDMAKFVRFLMGDRRAFAILQPRTLEMMLQPQLEFERDDRRVVSIGLAFFISDERGADGRIHRSYGHSGFQLGHRSTINFTRDGCCGFIFAANTATSGGNPSATQMRIDLVDHVFPLLRRQIRGERR